MEITVADNCQLFLDEQSSDVKIIVGYEKIAGKSSS